MKVGDGNCTPGEIAQDVATAIAEVIGTGLAPDSNFTVPALATLQESWSETGFSCRHHRTKDMCETMLETTLCRRTMPITGTGWTGIQPVEPYFG